MKKNYNRFAALEQIDTSTDIESNYDDETNDVLSIAEYDIADHNEKEQMKQNKMNRINDKNNNKKLKRRINLESNRIMRYMQDNSSVIVDGRGNQAYILATAPIYDEWVRNNYELQVWHRYFKMGTQDKHWAKEVITSTKKRNAVTNSQFIKKKDQSIKNTYWTQTTAGAINPITATTSSASANTGRIRDAVDRLEKAILKYIQHCTQHVKSMVENKIKLD
ncbi:unnamed protein product [Rotaria sp. Silwood1]|nr:unnamed protein product [Rotaria sp. Silwood1]